MTFRQLDEIANNMTCPQYLKPIPEPVKARDGACWNRDRPGDQTTRRGDSDQARNPKNTCGGTQSDRSRPACHKSFSQCDLGRPNSADFRTGGWQGYTHKLQEQDPSAPELGSHEVMRLTG